LVAIQQRNPRVRKTIGLYAWILPFPVVKAWSPWKNKTDNDDQDDKNVEDKSRLRLVNKKDNKLKADVKKADDLFSTGNTTSYEEAYQILLVYRVRTVVKSCPERLF